MKLAMKMLAAPLLTAVVVFGAGQVNSFMLSRASQANQVTYQAEIHDFQSLEDAQDQLSQAHTSVYRTVTLIGSLDEGRIKAFRSQLAQRVEGVKRVTKTVTDSRADDAELSASMALLGKQLAKYLAQADSAIDLSQVDPNTGVAAMQGADDTFAEVSATVDGAIKHVQNRSKRSIETGEARTRQIAWGLAALGLFCAAGMVTLSWLMQRKLAAELQRAAQIASEVARGNLMVDTHTDRKDEVGDLIRALGAMTGQLGDSMRDVRDSSESIRVASAEIATGNQDLSVRTEQTAANLQQAASSMEQLTGTVRQSADSARQANELAATAAEVAARGGSVVAQVVVTMQDINTSSRKINDIIGVIDGIAFQTNILALNAAVEAARAGEQGRGFAVVASEVRSLAQRSAQAAKEIKGLIGASVDKVEGGTRLVADAGKTMDEIVSSVHRVTQIIGEITASSAEQSDGIGQINTSVVHLDQMTQQNAALVEQSAAAAESLKEQACKLARVVSVFRLDAHTADCAEPRPADVWSQESEPVPPAAQAQSAQARNAAPRSVAATPAAAQEWETF